MPSGTYALSVAAGGISIQRTLVRTGDGALGVEVTLPAGAAISSWVNLAANNATGNLAANHGLSNATYDFHWYESSVYKNRYAVPVTISTNAISAIGGSGDDFPANATNTVVMTLPVTVNALIDGDELELLAIAIESTNTSSTTDAHILFEDGSGDDIAEIDLAANEPRVYDVAGGATNPFAGDIILTGKASCGSASEAVTLKIAAVYDSTP